MNYIWGGLILISIFCGIINGKIDDVINAMLLSVQNAVTIAIALIGIMAFWLGMVHIAKLSGLIEWFSRLISPILRLIFNELPDNSPAFSNIALNFSANALGLSNAATPFGIKAMEDLKDEAIKKGEDGEAASNSMCIFLGMNTAGFQLIPASVIAILIAGHADNPAEIILPTLIVTAIAFISAIIISKILAPFFSFKNFATGNFLKTGGIKKHKRKNRLNKFKKSYNSDYFNDDFKTKKRNNLKNLKNKGRGGQI